MENNKEKKRQEPLKESVLLMSYVRGKQILKPLQNCHCFFTFLIKLLHNGSQGPQFKICGNDFCVDYRPSLKEWNGKGAAMPETITRPMFIVLKIYDSHLVCKGKQFVKFVSDGNSLERKLLKMAMEPYNRRAKNRKIRREKTSGAASRNSAAKTYNNMHDFRKSTL